MSYQQSYGGYQQQPVYPTLPAAGQPSNTVANYGQQPQQQEQHHGLHLPHLPHIHIPFGGSQHTHSQTGALSSLSTPNTAPLSAPGYGGWNARQGYGYSSTVAVPALQPQQLETVSKDEEPVYGPLGRARGKIDRGLTSDNEISPDLGDLFAPCEFLWPPVN